MTSKVFRFTILFGIAVFFSLFQLAGLSGGMIQPAHAAEKKELESTKGKIVNVDPAKKTIRVEPGALTPEKDIQVTDQTKIIVQGKPGDFQALRKGDKVTVKYMEGDRESRVAEYIEVTG